MLAWTSRVIVKNNSCACCYNIVPHSLSSLQSEVISCQPGIVDLKQYFGIICCYLDDLEGETKRSDTDTAFIMAQVNCIFRFSSKILQEVFILNMEYCRLTLIVKFESFILFKFLYFSISMSSLSENELELHSCVPDMGSCTCVPLLYCDFMYFTDSHLYLV